MRCSFEIGGPRRHTNTVEERGDLLTLQRYVLRKRCKRMELVIELSLCLLFWRRSDDFPHVSTFFDFRTLGLGLRLFFFWNVWLSRT
jgi:hypothetical protein